MLDNNQLEAEVYDFKAKNQNFLELIKNIPEIKISSAIFHSCATPKKTSDGIVVKKTIGTNILKNILNVNEKEVNGNLPI